MSHHNSTLSDPANSEKRDKSKKKQIERWEKDALKVKPNEENQGMRNVGNPRVLVVDDNYYNIVAITSMFV